MPVLSAVSDVDGPPDFGSLSREELISLCRALYRENQELRSLVAILTQRLSELEIQIAELRSGAPPTDGTADSANAPPPFVKANTPKPSEKKARKARSQPAFRPLDKPTSFVEHTAERCPDCGRKLTGGWLHRTRQIIEVAPRPVQIIEHQVMARWCGVCQKRVLPVVDLSDQVVGKHRVGIGLMSWVGVLHILARVPLRTVQRLLKMLFGVHLGLGELTEILHTLAQKGSTLRDQLISQVRGSPYVHGDETGWREDGQNGYIWSFSTPSARVFVYNKSRAGEVAEEVLGSRFGFSAADSDAPQVLVSDFYAGYNRFLCRHQRCWVHLLRDLHKLRVAMPEGTPEEASVTAFVAQVRDVYDRARAYQDRCRQKDGFDCGHFDRQRHRAAFEDELRAIAAPYAPQKNRPVVAQTTLAGRMVHFLGELFTFVEFPEVPSENNAAERSVRPVVIGRKISGGTRSAKGSETKTALLTLVGTWEVQGKDLLVQCHQMLSAPTAQAAA